MAGARVYPPANRTSQWWESKFDRATMRPVSKLLLHTTETTGWPAYGAGASAPTLTYNPWMTALANRWRQHNYLDRSARALRDPSGTAVRENQDGVVQVEIVCYCDPGLYRQYGKGVNALPDHAYEDLGHLLAFLNTEWNVPLVRAPEWDTFPPADSIRMSGPEYDRFTGVLGHQHASGNTHGDPGMTNAQVDRLLAAARRLAKPPTGTTPTPPAGGLTVADINDIMALLGKIDRDATARYGDVANRVQAVLNEDRARYGYYSDKLNALSAGIADALAGIAADDANDITQADVDEILAQVAKLLPAGDLEVPKA